MIAGVVLAAGGGTRFGDAVKVLAPLRGQPVVRHVVERLQSGGLAPLVVVAGDAVEGVRAALEGTRAQVVVNDDPGAGMSASLRVGVAALPAEVKAFVVALGDQPLIDPEVVRALVGMWRGSHVAAVVPEYADGRGNPVLLDATLRGALSQLTGDRGARGLLEGLGDRVGRLAVGGAAPRDVDTPDDLRALET